MENNTAVPIIIVIVVVAIIAIAGMWWYFTQQSLVSNSDLSALNQLQNQQQNQVAVKSSQKAITTFSFQGMSPAVTGTIDNNAHTINLAVPKNTDVKNLVPTITTSNKATISPAAGSAQNFSSPVIYTVTAEDGSSQSYVVRVTVSST